MAGDRSGLGEIGRRAVYLYPDVLAVAGILDRERGRTVFELALPVMVTSGIWTVLRVIDFFMVSLALSDAAVAALELGFQYYFIGFAIGIGISSGTISLVSRFTGAGEHARADLALKQSLWFALAFSLPITAATWLAAEPLLDLLTDDPRVIELGAVYLRIVMLGLAFRFWTLVASRAFAGTGDTRTPMYVNGVTIPLNIALNAVLIFGLGPAPALGIAGAAWGTVVANGLAAIGFVGLLSTSRFDVRLRRRAPHWDTGIAGELLRVGAPLAGMRLLNTLGRFPFLAILAVLGTPVLAAFAIGRRVMQLAMIPSWGYATAASTLVGQKVGAAADAEATAFGWATLRIALATQLSIALVLVVLARPITILFDTATVERSVAFIRVFGLGIAAFSTAQVLQGGLRGAGDTRPPLYGAVLGTGLRLGVAALSLPATLVVVAAGSLALAPGVGAGVVAVYVAILADWTARALVNASRFRSGRWQVVARRGGSDVESIVED